MEAEQTQVNLLVARALEALGIPYSLGGSRASSVHGIYRATADADFVVAMRPDHAEPLVENRRRALAPTPNGTDLASDWPAILARLFALHGLGKSRPTLNC